MGVYDTIIVKCPNCGADYNAQSKSGPCEMREYSLAEAPEDVLVDVNRHAPFECECGCVFEVGENRAAVGTTMRPRKDHLGIGEIRAERLVPTLKFRAWLTKHLEMVEVVLLSLGEEGGPYIVHDDMNPHREPDEDYDCVTKLQDCSLMQFTGKHDKNGKEIFAGDIVKLRRGGNAIISLEEYEDGEGYTEDNHYGWIAKYADRSRKTLADCHSECEVIGNIYQDPELYTSLLS